MLRPSCSRIIPAALTLSLALAMTPASSMAGLVNLGTANAYNVFVLGNDTQSGTDVQGRLAVGGNANFTGGYSIGTNLAGGSATNLVVGGDYANTYNVVNGSAVVGGNATINDPTINGHLAVNGNVTLTNYGTINGALLHGGTLTDPSTTVNGPTMIGTTTLPVNFASERTYLQTLSANLDASSANGMTSYAYGTETLTGTNAAVDVFHIQASMLSLVNTLNIVAPAGATVVIDVDGASATLQGGMALTGVDAQHVLFNFAQATSLSISGFGVQGSILAPLASVSFNNGQINGTLVAGSLSGNGEAHNVAFLGNLSTLVPNTPPGAIVPEPATMLSTLTGLALVAGAAWRRRRSLPA